MNKTVLRTISGTAFVAVTLACLLLSEYLFAAYVLFIMVAMLSEFYRLPLGREKYRVPRLLAGFAAVLLFGLIFAWAAFGLPAPYISLTVLAVLAVIYGFSGILMVCFFAIIWASDVGAYIFGMAFGQRPGARKLCPEISPKKSWVGFWGGILLAVVAALILQATGLMDIGYLHAVVLAVLMDAAGVAGDLFESLWKRHFGVKDSGDVIPGHGQPTSIAREAQANPFLQPFNEPEGDTWWEQDGIPIKG